MAKLTPHRHLSLAYQSKGHPWPTVIAEYVDNAFDVSAGNADEVIVEISKDEKRRDVVMITDYGQGIEDINALAQLGVSGSYHHDGNIGRYGVGAKGWMDKARSLTVETIRDGIKHKNTFRLPPDDWPDQYTGRGRKTHRPSCSKVTLHNMKPDAGKIVIPAIERELQKRYWIGLRSGKKITLIDARKSPRTVTEVEPMAPPNWKQQKTFTSSVNGKEYTATVGVLDDQIGKYSGIYIGYLFRTITVETNEVPTRVHGQVLLSKAWGPSLNNYKDDIKEKSELINDIAKNAADVFKFAETHYENIDIPGIKFEINANLSRQLKKGVGDLGPVGPESEDGEYGQPEHDGHAKIRRKKKVKRKLQPAEQKDSKNENGVQLDFDHFGSDLLGVVRINDKQCIVTLNLDCDKILQLKRQPRYPGMYLQMGNEIAVYCMGIQPRDIARQFSGIIPEVVRGSGRKEDMINAIRLWFAFAAGEHEKTPEEKRA